MPDRVAQVLDQLRDHVERDASGACRGALADVGAAAEALMVVLGHHAHDAGVPLGLALRELTEVGDLRTDEQRRGPVGTGSDAGTAADAAWNDRMCSWQVVVTSARAPPR